MKNKQPKPRKRTKRNGHHINSSSYPTNNPYRKRKTKPLPNIGEIDHYDKKQVKAITLLNRDKQGNPTRMGRPTSYKPEYDNIVKILCKVHGLTNDELAQAFNTTTACLKRWRDTYPNFDSALKEGKAAFDGSLIEKSLKAKATGYRYTETSKKFKRVKERDAEGNPTGEYIVVLDEETISEKALPPDVGAIAFWLKNRDPDNWHDRKAVEVTGKDGGPVEHNVHIYMPDNGREEIEAE